MRVLITHAVAAVALAGFGLAPAAEAQAPAEPPSAVTVGFMHAIHATNDIERTLAFYRDVFGVSEPIRDFANPAVAILTNSPGATLRLSMLRLPGLNFELTQFANVERRAAQPNLADPGAPHMKFLVRDLAPIVKAVKAAGAPIITLSAQPVIVARSMRGDVSAIFFRDPDGYIVEAVQAPPSPDWPAGNLVGAVMGLTVENMDDAVKFWQGQLGWQLTGDESYSKDAAMLDLMGLKGAEFRTMTAVVPGSRARMEFLEIRGVPRKPFSLRVPDPGSSGIAIRVAAIHELLLRLKQQGVRVISMDEKLVEWSATLRNVFVKDPGGFNIELVGDAPK